jgi:GNAT superfamily N-acetyltransferase
VDDNGLPVLVVRLAELPADRLAELLVESERAGFRFVRRLVKEWDGGINRFERPGEGLFAAMLGERLVGVCGLNIDPYAAEPGIGRVRHLYVLARHRRAGVGGRLVREVVAAARGMFGRLRLRTADAGAARLYEGLGFLPVAAETDCTHALDLHPDD